MRTLPVYLIYLWTFVNIGRPQDIFLVLHKFHPGVTVAMLSFASYMLSSTNDSSSGFSNTWGGTKETRLLMALVFVLIITTPFSYYPTISINFLIDFLFKFGLYLYLVMRLINTRERIIGFLWTLVLCGLAMGVATFTHGVAAGRVSVGSTYDPNDLAMLLVTMLPLTVVPIFMKEKGRVKLACLVGSIFLLLAIMATQSRGGFLGLVAITLGMLFVRIDGVSRFKRGVPVFFLALIFVGFAGEEYVERMQTIIHGEDEGSGRILVWKRSLYIALTNPILGVGPSAFETAYGKYLDNDRFPEELSRGTTRVSKWQTAHNSFILILVELGIPGLFIYTAMILTSFKNLWKIINQVPTDSWEDKNLQLWATGLFVSFIGFNVCTFFLSQCYNTIVYVMLIISALMLRMLKEEYSNITRHRI